MYRQMMNNFCSAPYGQPMCKMCKNAQMGGK
jgi:hypothetical protein